MNTTTLKTRLIRSAATLAATTLLLGPALLAGPADAKRPNGSLGEVILETKTVTGQPYYALLKGWWGHEGGKDDKGTKPTYLSMDASDGKGVVDDATISAVHRALHDGGSFDQLRVAFVPYSADGSNERPHVTKGENAGEAFTWFADIGFGGALNGNSNKNDGVTSVSTLTEYTKWWQAGRPVQGFTNQLKVLDIAADGSTRPSATPEGKSILDRWPAGTKVSLVFYLSDGVDKAMPQVPTVKVGPDGRALTSWLTFEAVASPTNPVRTSGGYRVLTGAGTGPAQAARPKASSTSQGSNGQSANGQAGGTGSTNSGKSGASSTGGSRSGSSAQDKGLSRLTSALPGGQPTFWVLLVLLVLAAGAWAATRMRSGGPTDGGSPAPAGADEPVWATRDGGEH